MFGGVGFLLNGNMLVGVWKTSLIVRLGPDAWVYLPGSSIFVGIELRNPQQTSIPDQLEPLQFEL